MTTIIAEIGVNWDGDLELAEKMMIEAKIAGCDLVKFQAIDETKLEHPHKKRILKASISKENIEEINAISKKTKIEWFCTPMYLQAVELLNPYVNKFKIREFDGRSLFQNKTNSIIDSVLKTGKQIIVSTQKSPKILKLFENSQIQWIYCVPKYPCRLEEIDFKDLVDFDGYSNHCSEIIAPLTAVALGSKIVEIHITSDKSKDFIDNNVSFDYSELQELVKQIRLIDKITR
jgi:N,N'-diacetyllegionaminate synthase